MQFPEILEVIKILGFEDEDDTMQIKFGNTNLFSSVQSGIMEIIQENGELFGVSV